MTLRVVFDTSTLVGAALQPDSVPDQALNRAILFHQVFACVETLAELEVVLKREKFDRYVDFDSRMAFFQKYQRDSLLDSVLESAVREAQGSCRDDNDARFLALALAARADVIVSSDRDLLVLHPWRGIAIMTPAQFVAQIAV
jgi:putative PIN family toxin of toxin-antitoxin system